jgi:cephalosporin hydroxylase
MSLREWIEYHQRNIVTRQVNYRGVATWKNVFDLYVIQEIVHETQPKWSWRSASRLAVQRFLSENSSFVTAERREKFILAYAPGGFLKRLGG